MKGLTRRQQQCLSLIEFHHVTHGCSPKRAELARAMGLKCHTTATFHLRALERKGRIRMRGFERDIEIIPE